MYQIGEMVTYGIHGVCRVVDVEKQTVHARTSTYLVLEPVGRDGSRYLVPMHNQAAMGKLGPVLLPEELEAMLRDEKIRVDDWPRDENQRKQMYRELITSGDRAGLMNMVHSLYLQRKSLSDAGKRMHMADENFLRDAEKILAGEISVVMDMEPNQAVIYLRDRLA